MDLNPIRSLQRAHSGEEKLWKIWWQWGIPLAIIANYLTEFAEALRDAEHPAAGDAVDVVKLLLFIAWCRLAWRCAKNTDRPIWGNLTKLAVLLGFGVAAVTL